MNSGVESLLQASTVNFDLDLFHLNDFKLQIYISQIYNAEPLKLSHMTYIHNHDQLDMNNNYSCMKETMVYHKRCKTLPVYLDLVDGIITMFIPGPHKCYLQ